MPSSANFKPVGHIHPRPVSSNTGYMTACLFVVQFLGDWRVFKIPISCSPMKSVKTRIISVALETGGGSEAVKGEE